jgi:hypothetical protein
VVGVVSAVGSGVAGGTASTDRPLNGQQSGGCGERVGGSGLIGDWQQPDTVGSGSRQHCGQAGTWSSKQEATAAASCGGTQQQRTHGPAA